MSLTDVDAPATRMQSLMREQGKTFADLAYLTGMSRGHLCKVANGKADPSPETKLRIAKAFRCPPAEVFPG